MPKRNGKLSGKRWNDNVNKDGVGGEVKDVVRDGVEDEEKL